jgi:hypothetical protein
LNSDWFELEESCSAPSLMRGPVVRQTRGSRRWPSADVPRGPLDEIADVIALVERLNLDPAVVINDQRRDAPTRWVANQLRVFRVPDNYRSVPPHTSKSTTFPPSRELVDASESATGMPVADLRFWLDPAHLQDQLADVRTREV